jgi:hypothetical protein
LTCLKMFITRFFNVNISSLLSSAQRHQVQLLWSQLRITVSFLVCVARHWWFRPLSFLKMFPSDYNYAWFCVVSIYVFPVWRPPYWIYHLPFGQIVLHYSHSLLDPESVGLAVDISFLFYLEAEIYVFPVGRPPYWNFHFRLGSDYHNFLPSLSYRTSQMQSSPWEWSSYLVYKPIY